MPALLEARAAPHAAGAAPLAFYGCGEATLAFADCTPLRRQATGHRDSFDSLFERFLDITLYERIVLWAVARQTDARFLLCAAPEGVRLIETASERPLGHWEPGGGDDAIKACLRCLDDFHPRQAPAIPDRQEMSADLARWFELIGGVVGPAVGWSRIETQRLGYQLILGLKILADSPAPRPVAPLRDLGFAVRPDSTTIRVDWDVPETGRWVEALLAAAEALAPEGAGAFSAIERRGLSRQLGAAPQAVAHALQSLWQLAAVKRRPDVMLGLLTSPNHEHASWRLALTDPLDVATETAISDFYVFDPLEMDLAEVGFGRVLEGVEKLALLARDRDALLKRAGGRQLDFIEPDPEGLSDRAGALADPFNWVFRHALRLRVAQPYRLALGYLLALHVVDLRAREAFAAYAPSALTALPFAIELGSTDR